MRSFSVKAMVLFFILLILSVFSLTSVMAESEPYVIKTRPPQGSTINWNVAFFWVYFNTPMKRISNGLEGIEHKNFPGIDFVVWLNEKGKEGPFLMIARNLDTPVNPGEEGIIYLNRSKKVFQSEDGEFLPPTEIKFKFSNTEPPEEEVVEPRILKTRPKNGATISPNHSGKIEIFFNVNMLGKTTINFKGESWVTAGLKIKWKDNFTRLTIERTTDKPLIPGDKLTVTIKWARSLKRALLLPETTLVYHVSESKPKPAPSGEIPKVTYISPKQGQMGVIKNRKRIFFRFNRMMNTDPNNLNITYINFPGEKEIYWVKNPKRPKQWINLHIDRDRKPFLEKGSEVKIILNGNPDKPLMETIDGVPLPKYELVFYIKN